MRSRATFLVGALMVAGLLSGVTASSVAAATSTTVTWRVSSLTAGQAKSLSAIATSNSSGVKTWSKKGSCTLTPKSDPTKLTMGTGGSCTLKLKIAKSGKHPAKTSTKTIILALYGVGDTGPAGGTIFYVDLTRPEGSQYFEAACAGWSDGTCGGSDLTDLRSSWGCVETPSSMRRGTTIGTGEQNTTYIVAHYIVVGCTTARIAAKVAIDLLLGGQSDWYLPSKDELNQMYIQQTAIGGFSAWYYWSSTEAPAASAWSQFFGSHFFGDGIQGYGSIITDFYFRPLRSF